MCPLHTLWSSQSLGSRETGIPWRSLWSYRSWGTLWKKKYYIIHSAMKEKEIHHKLKTTHIHVEPYLMAWSIISYYTLVGLCKKKVTPLIMHWSYIFLALTYRYDIIMTNLLWTHERHPKPHSLRWASQCQLAFLNILEKNYSIIRRLNCT